MKDLDRDPRVLAREARRYRALLKDLILDVTSNLPMVASGSPRGHEIVLKALWKAERAGFPGGLAAKRNGR